MSVYLADWESSGIEGMIGDFERVYDWQKDRKEKIAELIKSEKYAGIEVLFAYYSYEDYSGKAFVLFRRDGKLYEVNGSHCSCYGLEDQWEPEETTVESIRFRMGKETWTFRGFETELSNVLGGL